MVDYPVCESGGESLASVLLRFTSGFTATLYAHRNGIPMYPLPFFQIFGDKVGLFTPLYYALDCSFSG